MMSQMQLDRVAAALGALALLLAPTIGEARAAKTDPVLTGLDSIHEKRREGAKVCFLVHEHYGEGSLPSRKGAEGAAIRAWQTFTSAEYGSAWGSYALAASKAMTCAPAAGRWTCSVTARPCRAGR